MKVAIIGAGIAGLSCAHELELHGITPVIFEKNDVVGEVFSHTSAILNIFNRPVRDPLSYLAKKYNIELKPLYQLRHITMKGAKSASTVSGNLGVFLQHGVTPGCIEKQLEAMVKTEINFNTYGDHLKLKDEFDYVVVATGTELAAKELGCFQELLRGVVYGAVILGDFKPDTLYNWFNTKYSKSGYAYMSPFNEKRASLALVIPNIEKNQIYDYWNTFIKGENIKNEIVQTFMTEHRAGFVYPHRINNIFLVGLASGCIDPFLGFGAIYSIITGVSAARSIALGLDYEQQIQNFAQKNNELSEYRFALNTMDNNKFDLLIKALGAPIARNLIYNTHINFPKYGSNANYALRRIEGGIYRMKASYYLWKNRQRQVKA